MRYDFYFNIVFNQLCRRCFVTPQEQRMDFHGQFRERRHSVQKSRRRAPVEAVAGVHRSRGPAHRGAHQDTVGEARVGQGAGVGQSHKENGPAGRAVPVHQRGDGAAPDQGLLCGEIMADGPEQRRLRGRRDVRGTSGRQAAEGRDPRHRAGLQVPDRAVWLGQVQSAAFVEGRHQVSI